MSKDAGIGGIRSRTTTQLCYPRILVPALAAGWMHGCEQLMVVGQGGCQSGVRDRVRVMA